MQRRALEQWGLQGLLGQQQLRAATAASVAKVAQACQTTLGQPECLELALQAAGQLAVALELVLVPAEQLRPPAAEARQQECRMDHSARQDMN